MRTTTRQDWRFTFTISDIGRLLGKSPVTLRGWENKDLIVFQRDASGDRKTDAKGVRRIAQFALDSKRISAARFDLLSASLTLVEIIERENNRKVKV